MAGIQSVASLVGLAPPDERDFVKRVIATGGQTVECCDDQHRVKVDGKPLDEPYIYWQPGTSPENHDPFEPVKVPEGSLWVMGDNRTYDEVCAIRAVHSTDGMTANVVELPWPLLERMSSRIINEVKGINRVVYDITTKPPGTIEWE